MADMNRRLIISRDAAAFVDKILKGAKPRFSTKIEMVINLKTAKALRHRGAVLSARPRPTG